MDLTNTTKDLLHHRTSPRAMRPYTSVNVSTDFGAFLCGVYVDRRLPARVWTDCGSRGGRGFEPRRSPSFRK
jgi:hypothetical protein